jgi:hypothetical protein
MFQATDSEGSLATVLKKISDLLENDFKNSTFLHVAVLLQNSLGKQHIM